MRVERWYQSSNFIKKPLDRINSFWHLNFSITSITTLAIY